jgi:hypothetical protein
MTCDLLPNTKRCEYLRQNIFRRGIAGDLAQEPQSIVQRREHQLLAVTIAQSSSRDFDLTLRVAQQIVVTSVCDQ